MSTTFSATFGSSDISDTGMVPPGIALNGHAPHFNGAHFMKAAPPRPPPAAPPSKVNDPLADMTPWQIYQRCIWISDEDTNTKISLLCLSRFMDKDLRAASMSYAQWARDCGFSERTAKRCAQVAANTWLRVGVGKGRYVPGKGHENRYDGVIPQKWADELRQRMRNGIDVKPDEDIVRAVDEVMSGKTGVSEGHPERRGVTHRHPDGPISGCQADTGVSDSPVRGVRESHVLQIPPEEERERGADAPIPDKSESAKKGSRLPEEWKLPEAWRPYARQRGLSEQQIGSVETGFYRYWTTQAGQKGIKLNWQRVWENWVDNQIDKYGLKPAGKASSTSESDVSAEAQRRAATDAGRLLVGSIGRTRVLEELRKQIERERGGAHG